MQTRTYQLYTTLSQANAANVTIVAPGYIHAILWSATIVGITNAIACSAELSFQSSNQLTTHNALGVIDSIDANQNFVTSGMDIASVCHRIAGLYIPVGIGQIVYLNTNQSAGRIKAVMHVIER